MTRGLRAVLTYFMVVVLWAFAMHQALSEPGLPPLGQPGPNNDPHWNAVRAFTIGPLIVLILLGCLAIQAMIATSLGRLDSLIALVERSATRLERGRRIILTGWGFAALLLLWALFAVLINIKPLALVGVGIAIVALCLGGLGLAVASLNFGRALLEATGRDDTSNFDALKIGAMASFLTEWVPVIGWVVGIVMTCTGIGCVLETIIKRDSEDDLPI